MALTKQSALFAWRSDFGPDPLVGGDPVYVRDSAAWWWDGRRFRKSITGPSGLAAPRFEPVMLDGVRTQAMLLEPAETNEIDPQGEFDGQLSNVTVTSGVADPFGGSGAVRVTDTSGTVSGFLASRAPGPAITGTDGVGVIVLRPHLGAPPVGGTLVRIQDTASSYAVRLQFRVVWNSDGSVGSATATTGTLQGYERLGDGYWGFTGKMAGFVSGNTHRFVLNPDDTASGLGAVDLAFWQFYENFVTSPVLGAAGTVRSADRLHWKSPPPPQGMVGYIRGFLGHGVIGSNFPRLWVISSSPTEGNPRLILFLNGTNGEVRTYYHNGTNAHEMGPASSWGTAAAGAEFEAFYGVDASGRLRLGARLNGGVVVANQHTGYALPSTWVANAVLATAHGTGFWKGTRLHFVKTSDLATTFYTGDLTSLMDELAEYDYLTAPEA